MVRPRHGLLAMSALWLASCSYTAAPQLVTFASIRDLMQTQVDPSADALWDSVAVVSIRSGDELRQPHSAAEWEAAREHALTLLEATNLLLLPHRPVASTQTSESADALLPAEIERRIEAQPEVFRQFVLALRLNGQQMLGAIERHDADALAGAGGTLDGVCEACHLTFWYPNQRIPALPAAAHMPPPP